MLEKLRFTLNQQSLSLQNPFSLWNINHTVSQDSQFHKKKYYLLTLTVIQSINKFIKKCKSMVQLFFLVVGKHLYEYVIWANFLLA